MNYYCSKAIESKKVIEKTRYKGGGDVNINSKGKIILCWNNKLLSWCWKEARSDLLQLKNAICGATGVYSCAVSCDKAIKLAALQCCTGDKNVTIDGNFIEDKLHSLLPCKYARVQGIASTVLEAYNCLDQELKNDSNKAKS